MNMVNKSLKIRIYPSKVDFNDNGEKIVSIGKFEQNLGNARFVWNETLAFIKHFKTLLIQNGYSFYVKVNNNSCNIILKMLKQEYSFLGLSESFCLQQTERDLNQAFKRYFNPNLKSNYPRFKSKKNKKDSIRIQNNKNNVRITTDKNGYPKLKLAKLGLVKFRTSKEYKNLLKKGSDPNDNTVKIQNATIKKENMKYYAIINIKCIHTPVEKKDNQQIGIDIGCKKLAVLSNENEIANLDLTKETDRIIHYQKIMSTHKKNSNRYRRAKKLYNKWWAKLKNKQKDYYDKKSHQIIENSSFIAVQNENILFWKHNPYLSRKIQLNSPRKFMDKIQYKAQWNNTDFEKIPTNIPTTQKCSKCGYKNTKLKGPQNLNKRNWKCPECKTYHDRDVNAAINILNEGLKRFSRRCAGAVKLS